MSFRELTPLHDLVEIKGTYNELTRKSYYDEHANLRECYLHITLLDEEDILDAAAKLRIIYPYLMKLDYDNTRTRRHQDPLEHRPEARTSPLDLFRRLYETQNNQPMNEKQDEFLTRLIESIWEEEV